jgi:hypothetical protein
MKHYIDSISLADETMYRAHKIELYVSSNDHHETLTTYINNSYLLLRLIWTKHLIRLRFLLMTLKKH